MPSAQISAETWHRPRFLSIMLIGFGLAAIPFALAEPGSTNNRAELERTAVQRQQYRADAIAGFPIPPHPDEPPRGPGG